MRDPIKTLLCALFGLACSQATQVTQQAQLPETAFERLFDPATTLTIVLEMPQATWNQIAAEQPVGGTCNFGLDPNINRYAWHSANATLTTQGAASTSQTYNGIGIKKKSFCGSLHNTKPSLTLTLDKFNAANEAVAESQIGTTHLSLENSKQDPNLFRQCAGYHVFRNMNAVTPMCTFVGLYRRDGAANPVFLGIYVLTEPLKKDFFKRRGMDQVRNHGSLYEFEFPDDFTPATIPQLQTEFTHVSAQDFSFAVALLQADPTVTALGRIMDPPYFVDFWATEIFLKSWDGHTNNRNNTFAFTGPSTLDASSNIVGTDFRFVPHGIDQIMDVNTRPAIYTHSIAAQIGYANDGLRYQLIRTLVTMGSRVQAANVPALVDSFVPLVQGSWSGPDPILGDPNGVSLMADHVKSAAQQAISDAASVFGLGLIAQQVCRPFLLVGRAHDQCLTGPSSTASAEVSRGQCEEDQPKQRWIFDAAPISMANLGFSAPLLLYRVRMEGSNQCLTAGVPFGPGYKLEVSACDPTSGAQRFFFVQREGRSFELHAYSRDACAHFSDSVVTSDNRPAVYLGACDGNSKNLIVTSREADDSASEGRDGHDDEGEQDDCEDEPEEHHAGGD